MRTAYSFLLVLVLAWDAAASGPYFATGIKIGEVDTTSAIVWVRLTRDAVRVPMGGPMPKVSYVDAATGAPIKPKGRDANAAPVVSFPEGATVETLEGAAPGVAGEVKVRYGVKGESATQETGWVAVDTARDFTAQVRLTDLRPDARYAITVSGRGADRAVNTFDGEFRTAPTADSESPVRFVVVTCTDYPDRDLKEDGFKIYPSMLALDPNFFAHTGDILYYDALAKSQALARWEWQQVYSLPTDIAFHRQVSSYFIKDDHDTWTNDCWPSMQTKYMGDFTFAQGQAIFREQVPMGEKTYRTYRWGKHLQVWMTEGRDFRSDNTMPDGPDKSIWGAEQKRWFKDTVAASDATFRVLISPSSIVGPDRDAKGDNHANRAFAHEGREIREFMAAQKNMVVLCGDRHWQYHSIDDETGLREYGCGAGSTEHAGGWPKDKQTPEQQYVNLVGGFLSVDVEPGAAGAALALRHRAVDGKVLHEDVLRVRDGALVSE